MDIKFLDIKKKLFALEVGVTFLISKMSNELGINVT